MFEIHKNKWKENIINKAKTSICSLFKWGWFKFSKCTIGMIIYSLAVNLFIVPNQLYTGGILGLAQLIRTAILTTFNVDFKFDISAVIYYVINIPLFFLGYKKISKTFCVRTLFTVSVNALFLAIFPIPKSPLISDVLANTLIGGILAGLGIGMVLSTGSSTGGTDIIGIVITKHTDKITVGSIGLSFNVIIYAICGIIYGIETMIYSIIFAVFQTIMIDRNHTLNIKSEAFIFTKLPPEKMIHFINYELKRGATYWEAIGGYTNTKTYIVYTVLSKYERMRLGRHMKEFDENAFMAGDDGVVVKGKFEKYMV